MAYSELIKNFEIIRNYMRNFYVYGFKSRNDYAESSRRTYDDARRRIESWLGDYMCFRRTPEGKNVFLSVDSRCIAQNPFYQAWKSCSFTNKDIALYFIIMDLLHDPKAQKSAAEIVDAVDQYLCGFENPMQIEESTIQKKLREYVKQGVLKAEKVGRHLLYSREEEFTRTDAADAVDFFSETAPCGVIGSYIQDQMPRHRHCFTYKHHYITQALDSDVLAVLLDCMQDESEVLADHWSDHVGPVKSLSLVPLRIYISAQTGRQYLMAFHVPTGRTRSYRLDTLMNVRKGGRREDFRQLREEFGDVARNLWGVSCPQQFRQTEHVEFELYVGDDEPFIVQRLEREKRCGRFETTDAHHYRFCADVWDSREMLPWIRTFICRITRIEFSNPNVAERWKKDLEEMYRLYGVEGGDNR